MRNRAESIIYKIKVESISRCDSEIWKWSNNTNYSLSKWVGMMPLHFQDKPYQMSQVQYKACRNWYGKKHNRAGIKVLWSITIKRFLWYNQWIWTKRKKKNLAEAGEKILRTVTVRDLKEGDWVDGMERSLFNKLLILSPLS